jgi:threonine/homoserine/homoserine lactone efflux protein
VAVAVTLTPGPAFALLVQTAVVHGFRTGVATIVGNSVGVLVWAVLSAVGVAALVTANRVAYDVLHLGGALFLVWLGARALWHANRSREPAAASAPVRPVDATARPPRESGRQLRRAVYKGTLNSLANPKLALFFLALFPQFLDPGSPVLPAALAMALVIVAMDLLWYGTVAFVVDRVRHVVQPRVLRRLEQTTGAALLAIGLRLSATAR